MAEADRVCPECGQPEAVRLISPVRVLKTNQSVWESSGGPESPDYYRDPRNIGRTTERRFREMDVEMSDSVKQQIQAAREGELPKAVKDNLK